MTSWAGWPVEPMLAISHGSWLMAALGEQVPGGSKSRGSRWRRVMVVVDDVGLWSVVGARLGCALLALPWPPPLSRCRGQRGREAHAQLHGSVHVVQAPSIPFSSPAVSVRLSQRRARAGQGESLAGCRAATPDRGWAIRDRDRPAAAVFATNSSRKGDEGQATQALSIAHPRPPGPVQVPVPVGEVAEAC